MASRSERQRRRRASPNEHGGVRQGQPGAQYANRSDLRSGQPPTAAPGQTYGEGAAQIAAQKAVPMGAGGPTSSMGATAQPMDQTGAIAAQAGGLPGLTDPTQRPGEPLTTGIAQGPGAGPEAMGIGGGLSPVDEIRAMYAAYPTDDMRRLLAFIASNPAR